MTAPSQWLLLDWVLLVIAAWLRSASRVCSR